MLVTRVVRFAMVGVGAVALTAWLVVESSRTVALARNFLRTDGRGRAGLGVFVDLDKQQKVLRACFFVYHTTEGAGSLE